MKTTPLFGLASRRPTLFAARMSLAILVLCLVGLSPRAHAQSVTIDSGAQWSLPSGGLSVAGGTLDIRGALVCGDAAVTNVNSLSIAASGEVTHTGACRYAVANAWEKQGAFVAGASTVRFSPTAPSTQTRVTGQTTFGNLTVDTPGAALTLPAGATQRVIGTLTLRGASSVGGAPVAVRSAQPGSAARLELDFSGRQNIANVAVSDVHATGAWLAANQINQGGSGNDLRWFGSGSEPVPVGHPLALLFLSLVVALLGAACAWRRSLRGPRTL